MTGTKGEGNGEKVAAESSSIDSILQDPVEDGKIVPEIAEFIPGPEEFPGISLNSSRDSSKLYRDTSHNDLVALARRSETAIPAPHPFKSILYYFGFLEIDSSMTSADVRDQAKILNQDSPHLFAIVDDYTIAYVRKGKLEDAEREVSSHLF